VATAADSRINDIDHFIVAPARAHPAGPSCRRSLRTTLTHIAGLLGKHYAGIRSAIAGRGRSVHVLHGPAHVVMLVVAAIFGLAIVVGLAKVAVSISGTFLLVGGAFRAT
jgi:hypothetical protein